MDIKKTITKWLNGPQDYQEGLAILQELTRKHKVLSKLMKGESKTRAEKLAYMLSKEIGLKAVPKPITGQSAESKKPQPQKPEEATPEEGRLSLIGKDTKLSDFPVEIQRVINDYSALYRERGKMHKMLVFVGDDNDDVSCGQRADLASKIKEISEKMEAFFQAYDAYKKEGVILTKALYPDPSDKKEPDPEPDQSVDDMKRLKKNLQASLVKDRNLILYKTKTKPDNGTENPLPEGPRKIKLEKRIKAKEKQIADLEMKIAKAE
jgi:hypothetical protein